MKLLEVSCGEDAAFSAFEASQEKLVDFIEALGLDNTDTHPAQVLVFLLSRVMNMSKLSMAVNDSSGCQRNSFSVLGAMKAILEEAD